jgi:hypothetical protein
MVEVGSSTSMKSYSSPDYSEKEEAAAEERGAAGRSVE